MKTLCQILSILCALFAVCWMIPGLIPFLGALQWLAIVCCVVGIFFGLFAERKIGLTMNIVVGIVAILRLVIGFGVA
jgi:hypothetical protein